METKQAPRTLVADDSDSMRQMLIMMLKKLGITDIVQARDGDEAIAAVQAGGIGLMLLDCVMPKVSGLEVLKTVRTDPALSMLPLVLVTANAELASVKTAVSHYPKADAVIVKPLSFAIFKATIEAVLNKAAA
jgi:two-component system chemotaxis response regulator CheY